MLLRGPHNDCIPTWRPLTGGQPVGKQRGKNFMSLLQRPNENIKGADIKLMCSRRSRLHVIFTFLFVKFSLLFCGCILVLLVLRDEIVHVTLRLSEFHFVHTLASVPMQEGLTTEHRC